MIAYDELEKALARWKARRPGLAASAASAEAPAASEDSLHGIPTGISEDNETPAADSTGELEIGDAAIVDEA
jgi:hypothetical protein